MKIEEVRTGSVEQNWAEQKEKKKKKAKIKVH